MDEIENIKKEIDKIKNRNKKVEAEKAREVSFERKILVAFLTYIIILIFMIVLWIKQAYINALIPTAWYLLSTLSIWYFKKMYIKRYIKKRGNL